MISQRCQAGSDPYVLNSLETNRLSICWINNKHFHLDAIHWNDDMIYIKLWSDIFTHPKQECICANLPPINIYVSTDNFMITISDTPHHKCCFLVFQHSCVSQARNVGCDCFCVECIFFELNPILLRRKRT